MQRGDAVDAVAADDGEVRHAHALLAVLVDERHAANAGLVAGERLLHLVEEAPVDLVDDLQVSRQHPAEQSTGQLSSASGSTVWFV